MRILMVAATREEVGRLISDFGSSISDLEIEENELSTANRSLPTANCHPITANCNLLITGVGMVATAFALGRHLAVNNYDLVLNLGIAGSFDRSIALGDVMEITTDTFAELGAENDEAFLSIDKIGFGEANYHATAKLTDLRNVFNNFDLPKVTAITVNTVHGNEESIKKVNDRLNPHLESMEGAAVFYACEQAEVPCLQIRAVSNYVEKRNRDAWQIGLAIKNLNIFAVAFLKLYA